MLRTSFWAVPAFIRVEPETTSAPVSTTMGTSARSPMRESRLETMATVFAPPSLAFTIASTAKGVLPEAEMATRRSFPAKPYDSRASLPATLSSSDASIDPKAALGPPATTALNRSEETPKVGGISATSAIPILPLDPAPAKNTRPPVFMVSTMASTP